MPRFNLMELLGKIPRDNTSYYGYEENPEFYDKAGKAGIKFRKSPDWVSGGRPFTLGNTIFIPPNTIKENTENPATYLKHPTEGAVATASESPHEWIAMDEIGHVAQIRERGLMGFAGKYLWDMLKNKMNQKALYQDEGSLEGFHYEDQEEKKRLQESILPSHPSIFGY